jgi:glycosyltransferase involved in cell wall biosynthesis
LTIAPLTERGPTWANCRSSSASRCCSNRTIRVRAPPSDAGFAAVTGDIVAIQDADLEYSPEELPSLAQLIIEGRADVVYGSRFLGQHRVFLFTHYLGNQLLTLITNVLYNTMLSDMETCYKVLRREVLDGLDLQSNGFGIEPEITAKIFKRHYRVYEVPITYDGRGYDEGKKITWKDGLVALWVLLRHRIG